MRLEGSGLRKLVLISGAPGAGKSVLAAPLSEALGLPLLSKDIIKESLHDSLGPGDGDPREWSQALGGAAMELLWVLAARFPAAVIEANFRPHSAYEQEKLRGLEAMVVEVNCRCPPAEATRRYSRRALAGERHPIHVLAKLTPALLAEFDRPMGVARLISVDTTAPVDVGALAAEVAAFWRASPAAGEGGEADG